MSLLQQTFANATTAGIGSTIWFDTPKTNLGMVVSWTGTFTVPTEPPNNSALESSILSVELEVTIDGINWIGVNGLNTSLTGTMDGSNFTQSSAPISPLQIFQTGICVIGARGHITSFPTGNNIEVTASICAV